MVRILLSIDDLARTRVVSSFGPVIESIFAVGAWLQGGGEYFRTWRRAVVSELSHRLDLSDRLTRIARSDDVIGDLLAVWSDGQKQAAPGSGIAGMSSEEIMMTVHDFSRFAVRPHWARTRARLDAERDSFRQIMSADGVEAMLRSLHPRIRWNAPVLEIGGAGPGELQLDGCGLLLSPSLFVQGPGHVLLNPAADYALPPAVVFPLRPDTRGRPLLIERDAAGSTDRALAALVGRTLAAALAALLDGTSTSQLADLLGVSSAAVSQHTAVLRAAGLIATRRNRNLVLHTITPLGRLLLRGATEVDA